MAALFRPASHADWEGTAHAPTGTVKVFNTAKGIGLITPEDGSRDVYVQASALEVAGIRSLNEGGKVSLALEHDRRGRGKQAGQIEKA